MAPARHRTRPNQRPRRTTQPPRPRRKPPSNLRPTQPKQRTIRRPMTPRTPSPGACSSHSPGSGWYWPWWFVPGARSATRPMPERPATTRIATPTPPPHPTGRPTNRAPSRIARRALHPRRTKAGTMGIRAPEPAGTYPPPRWEQRFAAGQVGLPEWAARAPDRAVVIASSAGTLQVHSFHAATADLVRATHRPAGRHRDTIHPTWTRGWFVVYH